MFLRDCCTERWTDRQTDRQTDIQTDRQADRQTDRQTDKQTDTLLFLFQKAVTTAVLPQSQKSPVVV